VARALCSPNGIYKGTVEGRRADFDLLVPWGGGEGGVSGDIEAVVSGNMVVGTREGEREGGKEIKR